MIGDFDGSANALWSLYGKEAKSHDQAQIQTLKEDMDGVLIFVRLEFCAITESVILMHISQAGLFSASLTSFVVDSKQSLQVNPTDQMVYYLKQHSTILSQISLQIASIAPQVSIPSTPPPPFPPFNPSPSDIRINAFWFMALTFSLSAALLAILVQQWVRDYMHIFQRYSDPLKSARMRQYLYEGSEGWYMPIAAEAVPGLLHVSLFLFFVGLADSTLNVNTTIGVTTTVPIGICGLLYIFTTLAPVIYPQSPYQTSFSGLIWYAIQKLHGRIFKDRDGESKCVSTNMIQGQMQLSMEETKERKGRDKRAIRWLLDNLTEDAEIESFAMSIPGSFNGEWSFEVWTELSRFKEDDMPAVAQPLSRLRTIRNVLGLIPRRFRTRTASRSPTDAIIHQPTLRSTNIHHSMVSTFSHERSTVFELSRHVGHLFETCKNRTVFASDELWRRRARACVEATVSLVCYANAELNWFGDILGTLGDIGSFEGVSDLLSSRRDQAFVMRWTCLSIMAIRSMLRSNPLFQEYVKLSMVSLGELRHRDGTNEAAEKNACEIDETLKDQWEHHRGNAYDKALHIARIISETDGIQTFFKLVDPKINVDKATLDLGILPQSMWGQTPESPFVRFDFPDSEPFRRQTFGFPDPFKVGFRCCREFLNEFFDCFCRIDDQPKPFLLQKSLQRTMWSLQDLRDGGGLGFAVILFLAALKRLLSSSQESYSVLYVYTFRTITSDWRRHKHSLGTQKLLLDTVSSDQGFLRTFNYPDYITDELWELLGDMLEGETGPHIDNGVQQLTDHQRDGGRYGAKALAVISRLRASCSQGSDVPTA